MNEENINDISFMSVNLVGDFYGQYNPENCVKVALSEQYIFPKQVDHIILFPKKLAYTNIFVFI